MAMTKNKALLKLSDNVILNKRNDAMAIEMAQTKDYYQKTILEAFAAFIPKQAVIYEMDSQFISHAVYFTKYCDVNQVYLFEKNRAKYKALRADIRRNKAVRIECLRPEWDKNSFSKLDKGKPVIFGPKPADIIHFSKRVLEEGLFEKVITQLEKDKPLLWLDTGSTNFAKITRWLGKLQYQVQKQLDHQAIYAVQKALPKSEPGEKHELASKIFEQLEIHKRQLHQLQQEYDKKLAQIKAEQAEKITRLEDKHHAIEQKWENESKKQAALAQQSEQKRKQYQKETREAKQVVQHISDALNAEKAVNHDLNKRMLALLMEEKPILLTMEARQIQQKKELSNLRYENIKLTRHLASMTEKYQRLNDTKVIRMMRKYWNFKKKRRLRNDT